MTDHEHETTRVPRAGTLTIDERLEAIEKLLQSLVDKLAAGQTKFATIQLRLLALEIVVYGACGLGLMGLAGALVALVLRTPATVAA